jgi:sugar phosphate isomerase/epimerase
VDGAPVFDGSRLLLSAGTIPTATFVERVEAARRAGFDAISLFPQQYLDARKREKLSVADMRRILSDNCISLDEVDPLLDWFGPTQTRSEALIFEIAQALGARSINAPLAFAPAIEVSEVTSAFARLCERAAAVELRVDLEFLPWTIVPDLSSALQIVREADQPNAGVMLDCWHFYRGGSDVNEISRLSEDEAARITSIQMNDAPSVPVPPSRTEKLAIAKAMFLNVRDGVRVMGAKNFMRAATAAGNPHPDAYALMTEAISARLLPGHGDIPLQAMLSSLEAVGCAPTVGLEVFSFALNRRAPADAASRVMQSYRHLSESTG